MEDAFNIALNSSPPAKRVKELAELDKNRFASAQSIALAARADTIAFSNSVHTKGSFPNPIPALTKNTERLAISKKVTEANEPIIPNNFDHHTKLQ